MTNMPGFIFTLSNIKPAKPRLTGWSRHSKDILLATHTLPLSALQDYGYLTRYIYTGWAPTGNFPMGCQVELPPHHYSLLHRQTLLLSPLRLHPLCNYGPPVPSSPCSSTCTLGPSVGHNRTNMLYKNIHKVQLGQTHIHISQCPNVLSLCLAKSVTQISAWIDFQLK